MQVKNESTVPARRRLKHGPPPPEQWRVTTVPHDFTADELTTLARGLGLQPGWNRAKAVAHG